MKKIILSVLIIAALVSCTKVRIVVKCYECEFETVNGVKPPDQFYCGELPANFKDSLGNPLKTNCRTK